MTSIKYIFKTLPPVPTGLLLFIVVLLITLIFKNKERFFDGSTDSKGAKIRILASTSYVMVSQLIVKDKSGTNVALGKPTSSSSTLTVIPGFPFSSAIAVDGNASNRAYIGYGAYYCSAGPGEGQWWEVNLQGSFDISQIVYYSPDRGSSGFNPNGMTMNVYNSSGVIIYTSKFTSEATQTFIIPTSTSGPTGPTGPKGDTGPKGITGSAGSAGSPGKDGTLGAQGPQGLQGKVGPAGQQGLQGAAGAAGPKGDRGDKGDKGDAGLGVNMRGNVATRNALPMSASKGDGYILRDTGNLAIWDGTSWNDVGKITGPKGDNGPKGDRGEQGEQGIPGIQGEVGPRGLKGDTGPIGPTGYDALETYAKFFSDDSFKTVFGKISGLQPATVRAITVTKGRK